MKLLKRIFRLALVGGSTLAGNENLQQLMLAQTAAPTMTSPASAQSAHDRSALAASDASSYRELDLLRRDGFSAAQSATVSLRVFDASGVTPHNLQSTDFVLKVNGTERSGRLQAPGALPSPHVPLVLLVFPPNQPVVHSIGVHAAEKYFSKQSNELLSWRVGILDANGKLTPFTNGRSQLLANLDVVDHTTEPLQYASDVGLPASFRWEGAWLTKAEEAISQMQRFDGPKVILAMNPLSESMYGRNDQVLAHNGPESLTDVAQHIGAHIYIANVGGPDVLIPGGDAADAQPAQVNTGGNGPAMGSRPSFNMQVDPRQTAGLSYFAYRTSIMMQTAKDTMGGFSNSLSDLAGYIHRDLDENYLLTFDLNPADRDKGIPTVEVRLINHAQRVAILDVAPIGSLFDSERKVMSREVMDRVRKATRQPVPSSDFRINQQVDYFPLREGLEPVLPMSCLVEWTGEGPSPRKLMVAESVEDTNLSSFVLERDVQASWNGRSVTWERDGHLHPGHYIWRVAVHDEDGKVFASTEKKITIENPQGVAIASSSLIVGKVCRADDGVAGGLRRRTAAETNDADRAHFQIDPMRAADCRLKPEPTNQFKSTDLLHAFVRLYPSAKLEKHPPDQWTASFMLRSASGSIEAEHEIPFKVDSGSGYLAYVEIALNTETIRPGPHTLDVMMRGPGIRKELKLSRPVFVAMTREQ